jgi:hypothetical protein
VSREDCLDKATHLDFFVAGTPKYLYKQRIASSFSKDMLQRGQPRHGMRVHKGLWVPMGLVCCRKNRGSQARTRLKLSEVLEGMEGPPGLGKECKEECDEAQDLNKDRC